MPDRRVFLSLSLGQGEPPPSLVPRESKRWKALYRGCAAYEREFGRLKKEWVLIALRVREVELARRHADLTIVGKLACALS